MRATVTVYPRKEILDPQGKAIRDALGRIGFDGVDDVRAGKSFAIDLAVDDAGAAREQLDAMCKQLLANPVVEDYEIDLHGEETAP